MSTNNNSKDTNQTEARQGEREMNPDWDGQRAAVPQEAANLLKQMREEMREEKPPSTETKPRHPVGVFSKSLDFGIRYVLKDQTWYVLEGDEWLPMGGVEAVRRYLTALGLNPRLSKEDREAGDTMSEVTQVIQYAETHYFVDFVGNYSGYLKPGSVTLPSGDRILVPRGRKLPGIARGDWPKIKSFLTGLFRNRRQRLAFLGWLQVAVRTLREDAPGDWTPGQALVLLGDSGIGKSTLQIIISAALTGRFADPTSYFLGRANFSGEMALAEHWAMSDPEWEDAKQKARLAKGYKKAVADSNTATEAKYQQTINIPLFKRVTTSINDDEDFQILPLMDRSYLEKLMMLDCSKSEHMPTAKNWKSWRKEALAEVPAFLGWLLNRFEIPAQLAHERYGVAYRNKRWEPSISAPTKTDREAVIDEIMLKAVFPFEKDTLVILTTTELHMRLYGKDSPIREAAAASNLPRNPAYLGRRLMLWITENGGERRGYRIGRLSEGKYSFIRSSLA
jgi:hypothetical protein